MSKTQVGKNFSASVYVIERNKTIGEQHAKLKAMNEMTAVNKLFDICNLYQKVKPALLTAKRILFFMPKVQKTLQHFIDTLDNLCPEK